MRTKRPLDTFRLGDCAITPVAADSQNVQVILRRLPAVATRVHCDVIQEIPKRGQVRFVGGGLHVEAHRIAVGARVFTALVTPAGLRAIRAVQQEVDGDTKLLLVSLQRRVTAGVVAWFFQPTVEPETNRRELNLDHAPRSGGSRLKLAPLGRAWRGRHRTLGRPRLVFSSHDWRSRNRLRMHPITASRSWMYLYGQARSR